MVPMFQSRLLRSFAVLTGAVIIASCTDSVAPNPLAPVAAAASHGSESGESGFLRGSLPDPGQLELKAVWWKKQHKNQIRVSQTITRDGGGTISIRETGLTIQFPAHAVDADLVVTVTA